MRIFKIELFWKCISDGLAHNRNQLVQTLAQAQAQAQIQAQGAAIDVRSDNSLDLIA